MMTTWGESEIVNFKVAYDGSAVTNNEMDAKILADSLLGISAAIEESNKIINGKTSEVFIKVKSDFKPGSFEVELVQFLTSQGMQAATNLITILGLGGIGTYGLIHVIKVSRGGKIIKKQKVDGDYSDVYFDNCPNPIAINKLVIDCYESKPVMDAVRRAMAPLNYEGYDTVGFSSNDNQPELFGKEEYNFIKIPNDTTEDEEILDVTISEGIFGIAQTNLDGNDKGWRLSRSEGDSFPVTILDNRFLSEINNGKYSFTHGTAARVKYRDITKKRIKVIHEYEILEVISLYPPDSKIPKLIRKERKLFEE